MCSQSLLGRLQHAPEALLSDALSEYLRSGGDPSVAAKIIETRLEQGAYVLDKPLTELIIRSRRAELYEPVRDRIFKNIWSLIDLYRAGYPDPQIETVLCQSLYNVATDDSDITRVRIAEAFRDCGSTAVLPTLEALLFDLEPATAIAENFSDALDLLGEFKVKARADFSRLLSNAIEAVKLRAERVLPHDVAVENRVLISDPVDDFNNISRAQSRAKLHLDSDPVISIFMVRMGAEALAKELYRQLGHDSGGRPAKKMTLEDLLKPVKDSSAPDILKILIQAFQLFGNFASHDQDGEHKHVSKEIASAVCTLYDEALRIYGNWTPPST